VNTDVGPAVGRRRLAVELRRLRTTAGLTIQDVATAMECSVGKVSRVETGLVTARIQDVREMLDLYSVPEPERAALLDLVRQSRMKAWWHAYGDVVPPESAKYYGLEDGAATIREYGSVLVPGLLQTEQYAAALMSATQDDEPTVTQRRLELRMRRQQLLTREDPPSVEVILHEPVLHNTMTGKDVTAGQLTAHFHPSAADGCRPARGGRRAVHHLRVHQPGGSERRVSRAADPKQHHRQTG
jgi:transcriptional regulator with XRE-family HTH domain